METLHTPPSKFLPQRRYYWRQAISAFFLVLLSMPLGHAFMILMEHYLDPSWLYVVAFLLGLLGMLIAVYGVFIKGDTAQTLCGFFGGLMFWTGWVEFLFMYYARRYGVQAEVIDGEIVTKPEYLIMPVSLGFWAMFMFLYLFSARSGCNFLNWLQKNLFRSQRKKVVASPMVRHSSIVSFMELNMMLWTCYLLLMLCYDPVLLGDRHPLTLAIGVCCLVGSVFIFRKQLHIASWGANIRMAIATVIVLWTAVEIAGRIHLFEEIWIHPRKYLLEMGLLAVGFLLLLVFFLFRARRKKR